MKSSRFVFSRHALSASYTAYVQIFSILYSPFATLYSLFSIPRPCQIPYAPPSPRHTPLLHLSQRSDPKQARADQPETRGTAHAQGQQPDQRQDQDQDQEHDQEHDQEGQDQEEEEEEEEDQNASGNVI